MKKFIATIFVIIYLTSSAGVTIHLHYCMGEFVSFSFSDTAKASCAKCGMSKHKSTNDCCTDVKLSMKITDKHLSVSPDIELQKPFAIPVICFPLSFVDDLKKPVIFLEFIPISYPPGSTQAVYILHRNLRI